MHISTFQQVSVVITWIKKKKKTKRHTFGEGIKGNTRKGWREKREGGKCYNYIVT